MGPVDSCHPLADGARREDHPPRRSRPCSAATATRSGENGRSWSARCAHALRDCGAARRATPASRSPSRTTRISAAPSWSPSARRRARRRHRATTPATPFPVAEAPLDFTRVIAPHVAPRAPQGLPRPVHRRGLSPGPLRHRRRRGAVRGDRGDPRRASPDAHRRCSSRARSRRGTCGSSRPAGGRATRRSRREALAACLAAARHRTASPTTPTTARHGSASEDGALVAYELDMIRRSAANMRALGSDGEETMSGELSGKVAFVTGSGRGLGRVMAERLAELGADVAIHDLDWTAPAKYGEFADLGEVGEGDREAYGVRTVAVTGNIGDPDAVAKMKAEIEAKLGPVEILVNCAGGDIGASGSKPSPNNALHISVRGHPDAHQQQPDRHACWSARPSSRRCSSAGTARSSTSPRPPRISAARRRRSTPRSRRRSSTTRAASPRS